MADELDDLVTQVTTVLGAMTGVSQAPEHPPEQINDPPMLVTRFVRGRFEYSQGSGCIGYHTLYADLLLPRGSGLPHCEGQARPYILRAVTAAAAAVTMNGTCEHCIMTGYEGPGDISGYKDAFGLRIILEAKIKHSGITVSA